MDNLCVNVDDYIGKFVKLVSANGFVVRGVIYRTKDLEILLRGPLLDCTYAIVSDIDNHIYSFEKVHVKSIEVIV